MSLPAFNVTVLGSSSSMPTADRHLSGHFIQISERFFLLDCGEGTQFQLIRFKLKFQRINHIFISHLHGDHFFGLLGLCSTMHLLGRNKELHVYGPPDLDKLLKTQSQYAQSSFNYKIIFHELGFGGNEVVYENKTITITTIKLNHRIPCNGFLIREKDRPRKLLDEAIEKYNIPEFERNNIKMGRDFEMPTGKVIPNELMTADPEKPRSYAYCTDTAYNERMIEQISNVDLLYHEATFTEDMVLRARETYHSTSGQAAEIASKAEVKQLMLGHFSARYKDITPILEEARRIFAKTELAEEGKTYAI